MFEAPGGLVLTCRQVMYEEWPILNVLYDVKNDRWSFVNGWGDTDDETNGIWVHPEQLIDLDGSIADPMPVAPARRS